jgi:hypothetical protein
MVLSYFTLVKLKKGIINYKSTNRILAFPKHLEMTHKKNWIEWIEHEIINSKIENQQKRSQAPPHPTLHLYLVVSFLTVKLIPIKFNLKVI